MEEARYIGTLRVSFYYGLSRSCLGISLITCQTAILYLNAWYKISAQPGKLCCMHLLTKSNWQTNRQTHNHIVCFYMNIFHFAVFYSSIMPKLFWLNIKQSFYIYIYKYRVKCLVLHAILSHLIFTHKCSICSSCPFYKQSWACFSLLECWLLDFIMHDKTDSHPALA